ncbi:MAG: 3-methyl-2-oxobutanoate hydroxymethyltransferase [Thermoanaerobaculia bacterium]
MSAVAHKKPRKITIRTFQRRRDRGRPITMVTAYDYPSARAADAAGIDAILVGDSLAMVVLGYDTTLPVTMEEMLHHARAVRRGARSALLIGDMPFMSYQTGPADALTNAGRYLKEAGMDAVKLEGGRGVTASVCALVASGIPVQGHLGLTPQSVHALGGYRVQGKTRGAAARLLDDALALEAAGCFSVVLESVPARLARYVTERLTIPTLGIGAGAGVSGQVLVFHDLLGLQTELQPRFVKRFAQLGEDTERALKAYRDEVRAGIFPAAEHGYEMPDEEWEAFLAAAVRRSRSGPPALAAVGG